MSSDLTRRFVGLTAFAALAGCGFAPAFGSDGSAQALRNTVQVVAPDTVAGFAMRTRINDRLGIDSAPRYLLELDFAKTQQAAAITADGDTTRFQIAGISQWTLTNVASGVQYANGRAQSFTSFAATGSTVATQAAAADALDRLAIALADQIVADLTLSAGSFP